MSRSEEPSDQATAEAHSDQATAEAREPERRTGGPVFWVGVVLGWGIIALGIRGLLHDHVATNPRAVGRLIIQTALIHDLVLAPVVCGVGLLLARLLKPPLRALVGGGLIASAIVSLYAFPFVRGYGRSPNMPSALPLDYGRGLVIILVAIWLIVLALWVWARRRPRPIA